MKQSTKKKKQIRNCSKEWYSKNKDKQKDWMKDYYKEHKLELRLNSKQARIGYNRPLKNIVRENLIKFINQYNINSILTLESKDFIFSKELLDKKIVVFERDLNTYNQMLKTKPKNVNLFLGDVCAFKEIDMPIDLIYLDFCGKFSTEKEVIYELKDKIKSSKLFAFTFSLRENDGWGMEGDYQFILLRKISELLNINFKVIYGEAYRDTTSMVTILLQNGN